MYNYEYSSNLNLGRVCLEMSLKPFKQVDDTYINNVCKEVFYQYRDMLDKASSCSVLLWVADGSDILDYSGDLLQEMEWAKYMGNPNFRSENRNKDDILGNSLHYRSRYYVESPPIITYERLKKIISSIKEIGNEMTGLMIEVGATFDPGPEFAISDFKYNRHKEIATGIVMGENMWCHCAAILNGDDHKYAAFPKGIPDKTQFGTFLAKQYKVLAEDVGYDYIWLSNGFGYSLNSWNWRGECFDGVKYKKGIAKKVHDSILEFWNNFSSECPDVRIETRGSNLSTGMDIGAHGSPIKTIYDNYNVTAPPNSPWAALDSKFALELVGYMSRIALLPKNGHIFRYYLHDPWWLNSPWFDRYGQQPHDIYLPLAIARLDENGKTTPPFGLSLLSIDDSNGDMPRRGPTEITPHILNAYEDAPDTAGPITWIYPFSHYNNIGIYQDRAGETCFGDWFINDAIENGFPVSTVIGDDNITGLNHEIINDTIVMSIVPDADSQIEKKIFKILSLGGEVMLYGPVDHASKEMLDLIGVSITNDIQGYGLIETDYCMDSVETKEFSYKLGHKSIISGGGVNTISNGKSQIISKFIIGNETRAYSTYNPSAIHGKLVWVRGSYSQYQGDGVRMPNLINATEYFQSSCLMRYALKHFDININFNLLSPDTMRPIVLFSRKDNGMYVTGFAPDATVKISISLKDGIPVMRNCSINVDEKGGEYAFANWWHDSCRVFVKQIKKSTITSRSRASVFPGKDRKVEISGLVDAQVTFLIVPNNNFTISLNDDEPYALSNVEFNLIENGKKAVCKNITGKLTIAYGEEPPEHLK